MQTRRRGPPCAPRSFHRTVCAAALRASSFCSDVKYRGTPDYAHEDSPSTGVLLVNLGTPSAPTAAAVRRFLAEFLWDPRVIEAPRWLWWVALHGIILRIRPRRSAAAYREIWTDQGSPLLEYSRRITDALGASLAERIPGRITVVLGMRYGRPSLAEAVEALARDGARRVVVLPLYPQYSSTTTGSTFDALAAALREYRWLPELSFIAHYHDHPGYISALASSVRDAWTRDGRAERLLFSFHGLPRRYFLQGDPYHCECLKTARLVAGALQLPAQSWAVSFQSRVGREEWLRPYTEDLLADWAGSGVRRIQVICPGFATDCLETLEEVAIRYKHLFEAAGGERLDYIPALNDREQHICALRDVIAERLGAGSDTLATPDSASASAERRERALRAGASR